MILLLTLVVGTLALPQVNGLIKEQSWSELIAVVSLWLLGYLLMLAIITDRWLPPFYSYITIMAKRLFGM